MDYFYLEDSKLPVASTSEVGVTRLSDEVPSDSQSEAATIHSVSKAFYPAAFSSNLAIFTSDFVSTAVYPTATYSSNVAVFSSNLSVGNSNALFPLVGSAISKADGAQSTANAGLASGTAAGVTATAATAAAMEANSLAVSATALATANQATLALHDARILHAQSTADVADTKATSAQHSAEQAQQTAEQAQQTACNAVNKTRYWDFTQDCIQNLQQPTLELTYSNDTLIHINKSLHAVDTISCDNLLSHTDMIAPAWRAPDSTAEMRYTNNNMIITCDSLQMNAATQKQFSVSNGTCYVASDLQMPSTATIKCLGANGNQTEGIVRITQDALRFLTLSNNQQKLSFSANSNGLFALSRCALFGATESTNSFPRLEMTLADGLRFGSGIKSQLAGPDRDLFRVDNNGDISCYNRSSGLLEGLTSNASISKGTLKLEAGGLTVSSRPVVTAAGEIVRRVDLDAADGFKVSPSGYLIVGGLQINPQGVMTSTCNISALSFTENGIPLSNEYALQGTALQAAFGSNTASYASNVLVNYSPQGSMQALSNYVLQTFTSQSNAIQGAQSTGDAALGAALAAGASSAANATAIVGINTTLTAHNAAIAAAQTTATAAQGAASTAQGTADSANSTASQGLALARANSNLLYPTSNLAAYSSNTAVFSSNLTGYWQRQANTVWTPSNLWVAGSVGIGLSNPLYKLDVVGTVSGTSFSEGGVTLAAKYASSNVAYSTSNAVASNNINLIGFSNWSSPITVYSSNTAVFSSNLTGFWQRQSNYVYTPSNLWVAGNVGIGLSNPAYKLDVSGTVNATLFSEAGVTLAAKYASSNVAYSTSNALQPVSQQAVFGSNTSSYASNALVNYSPQGSMQALSNYALQTFASQSNAIQSAQSTGNAALAAASAAGASSAANATAIVGINTTLTAHDAAIVAAQTTATSASTAASTAQSTADNASSSATQANNLAATTSNALRATSNALSATSNIVAFCSNVSGYWQRSGGFVWTPSNLGVGVLATPYRLDVNGQTCLNGRLSVLGSGYAANWDHISIWHDGSRAYLDAGGCDYGLNFRVNAGVANLGSALYSNVMTLLYNGCVGIGTTNPAYKLEVAGTVRPVYATVDGLCHIL